ncbi:hypothetical protein [Klebsiella pneumoniae]|uniref:hypothetical protein n=1 Tax=Klebsiella pneumoniae TaxID=573 RepID=UPI003EBB3D1B
MQYFDVVLFVGLREFLRKPITLTLFFAGYDEANTGAVRLAATRTMLEDGLNGHEINAEKRRKVVLWLAKFGFSTRELLSHMLGVAVEGQAAFFKRLAEDEITKEAYVSGTRKRVVTLTPDGVRQAKIYEPALAIKNFKKFPLHTLIHGYTIQSFLISQKGVQEFYSEAELATQTFVRRPDLIIVNESGIKIAIEVELTQKDVNRIYYNFGGHVQDWQKQKFAHVIYLFSSPTVRDHYDELYQKNPWPKFISATGNVRHITRAGSFDPSNVHNHGLIYFHQFDSYVL